MRVILKGKFGGNEFHICVRVCGVEGRGKKSFRSVLLRLRERRPRGIEHEVKVGCLLQDRTKFGLAGLFRPTEHPKPVYEMFFIVSPRRPILMLLRHHYRAKT